jgi:hypothetical protein
VSLFSAANLIRGAAVLLILCGVLHTISWRTTRARFLGEERSMAALLWFLLGTDWLVLGLVWLFAATVGRQVQPLLLVTAAVPIAVAIGLCVAVSPRFLPVYLQTAAAVLLIAGALKLS